ncbi:hypothetical protein [Borreliella valaisiana]|nr:hypothetical protein KJD09_06045 [Borreliella valaisiana]
MHNTRRDLRAKLNEGNQRYTGVKNEPETKIRIKMG